MEKFFLLALIIYLQSFGINAQEVYSSDELKVIKLKANVYRHVSYLKTEDYGKVACNGMIITDQNEAIIYDTPSDNETSIELIEWVQNELNCKIKAVVPTHFHIDCLGGLEAFHSKGIPSFGNQLTIQLANKDNATVPKHAFDKRFEHKIGNKIVVSEFIGTGHTRDNIIGYSPTDKVLFGGCLIKSINAGTGNLNDATPKNWSETVEKLKNSYPEVEVVIPGHGKEGGIELLDYTISMFADQ